MVYLCINSIQQVHCNRKLFSNRVLKHDVI